MSVGSSQRKQKMGGAQSGTGRGHHDDDDVTGKHGKVYKRKKKEWQAKDPMRHDSTERYQTERTGREAQHDAFGHDRIGGRAWDLAWCARSSWVAFASIGLAGGKGV